MKTMKNDTRYIIKRIIIGVGIAVILGLLKTNNVFAMEQQNYCFDPNASGNDRYSVIDCSNTNLNNNLFFKLKIVDTPMGPNVFTFYTSISSNSRLQWQPYAFGYENLVNHDIVFLSSGTYQKDLQEDNQNFQYFGISNTSGNSFIFNNLNDFSTGWVRSGFDVIYVTEDQGRALDIYNSNMFNSNYYVKMSHVNEYYFVAGIFSSSFVFNNYFNDFTTDWVLNQLNMATPDLYEGFEENLYVLDTNSTSSPTSIIDDIPLDDTSNNFNVFPQDYWVEGFNTGGDELSQNSCSAGGLCADNIESWLNLLTIPFNFLKSLNKNNCSAIDIPLPFSNSNIRINCLSSTFQNVLGQNFYNIILYVISGLIAYRVTLRNIDTITDVIDPSDDKIEVIDL